MSGENDGLEALMSQFRVGEKKSNLIDVNINQYFPNNPVNKIADMLEQSNNLSNRVYRMNFDPVQEIVLKKMITEETLSKRLIIEENYFFKGIFFLNYYCSVIARSHEVIDSLYSFAVQLEKIDRSKDPLLNDVVEHVLQNSFKKGLFIGNPTSENTGAYNRAYNSLKQESGTINLSSSRFTKTNPIYNGAARIISGTIIALKEVAANIESRADLEAVIFTDTIYPYIQSDPNLRQVNSFLERKEFLNASITALQVASKNYYAEHIDKSIGREYRR